ncbi:MAG: hypothetical protein M3R41_10055 [Pseudomonadota bacterium]|nr:hypothetical protein [Pseudomonadota bacterium]
MRVLRAVMFAVGLLAILLGLLWVGQGLGFIHWPEKGNFMLGEREWVYKGAGVVVIGLVLAYINRPRGRI